METEKSEKLIKIPLRGKNGGHREGSGRKKGSMNKETLEKKLIDEEIKQRVLRGSQKLINSQMNLAHGCQFLYRVDTKKVNGQRVERKPKLVTSQAEIEDYLEGEFDDDKDVYYFITTKEPDNRAIDSLLDRTLGKPSQSLEVNLEAKITLEQLTKSIKEIADVSEDSKDSGEDVQRRDGEAIAPDRRTAGDFQSDIQEALS